MRVWRACLWAGAMVAVTGCGGMSEVKKPEVPKVEVPKIDPYVAECKATREGVAQLGETVRMKDAPEQAAEVKVWPLMVDGYSVPLPAGAYTGLRIGLVEGKVVFAFLGDKTRVVVNEVDAASWNAPLAAEQLNAAYGEVDDWAKYSEGLLSAEPTLYDYYYLGFKHGYDGVNCDSKGRGHNTVLMAGYPVAKSYAQVKEASAVYKLVPQAPPAEGEEAPVALDGMVLQGKTLNAETNQSYDAWTATLRKEGKGPAFGVEYTALAEGSNAQDLAFLAGHKVSAAEKAPKWLPALEAAVNDPTKANLEALKKSASGDKKLDKKSLATIEAALQQVKAAAN